MAADKKKLLQSNNSNNFFNVLPIPPFLRLASHGLTDLGSVGMTLIIMSLKHKIRGGLQLGGSVTQHRCREAWKQWRAQNKHGSNWGQKKDKIDEVIKIKRKRRKKIQLWEMPLINLY